MRGLSYTFTVKDISFPWKMTNVGRRPSNFDQRQVRINASEYIPEKRNIKLVTHNNLRNVTNKI